MPSGTLGRAGPCWVTMLMPGCKPGKSSVQELNLHSIARGSGGGGGLKVADSDSELLFHSHASRRLFIQKPQGSLGRSQGSPDHDL